MQNYKFSLESVLEVRSNDEKNVLEDFVKAQNSLVEEENKKKRLHKELQLFMKKPITTRNIRDLIIRNDYKADLDNRKKLQYKIIEEKKIELEKVRLRLQEAQKDKKIMEKLREKDLDQYQSEIEKKNQKEIDEFAVLRFKSAYDM